MSSNTNFMPVQAPVGSTSFGSAVMTTISGANALYVAQVKPTITELVWGGSANFITNVSAYPFDISLGTASWKSHMVTPTATIETGSDSVAEIPTSAYFGYDLGYIRIPTIYGDFRDYEPYVRYSIYLPYFGEVDISASDIVDKYIRVFLNVDFLTGFAMYTLALQTTEPTASTDGFIDVSSLSYVTRILTQHTFKLGGDRPFSNTGFTDSVRNNIISAATLTASAAKLASQLSTPVIAEHTTGGGQETPAPQLELLNPRAPRLSQGTQPLQLTGSVPTQKQNATGAKTYRTTLTSKDSYPLFTTAMQALSNLQITPKGSVSDAIVNMYSPKSCQLIIRKASMPDPIGRTFGRAFGYPLEETTTIGELKGFTCVDKIDTVTGFETATIEERQAINYLVTSGIFIEYALNSFKLTVNGSTTHTIYYCSGQTWRQFASTGMNSSEYQGTSSVVKPAIQPFGDYAIGHFGDILTDFENGDYGILKYNGSNVYADANIISGATYTVTI